jgi:small Trp-rich protein
MYLVVLGVILVIMKWRQYGPVADLSWWAVLAPFLGAVLWWYWADATGYTKRKAMERENKEVQKRIDRNREAIRQKIRGGR